MGHRPNAGQSKMLNERRRLQLRSVYEPNIGHEESFVNFAVTFRMLYLSKLTGIIFRNGVRVPPKHEQLNSAAV